MTARLKPVDPATATGKAKELLDAVQAKMGMTPNMMKTLANAPAALEAYLAFSGALGGGQLDARLREQIALAVGEANRCEYCLSAHTLIGKMVGLNETEVAAARQSTSSDPKTEAALHFAHQVVANRGEVTDEDVRRVREAGYTEGEVAEIVANVALNIFTNYFNHVSQPAVDFPKIALAARKTA